MVLASTRGDTAKVAAERLAGTGIKMVVVPHQYGFISPTQRFPTELCEELIKKGHKVHFGTMLFHTEHFYGGETPRITGQSAADVLPGDEGVRRNHLMASMAGMWRWASR